MSIQDKHGRLIDYLRVSVTDRCNLRCFYCMPPEGIEKLAHSQIMGYEEIKRFIEAAAQLGISKIRFTGGEPLVRKDFYKLIESVKKVPGIEDLSMTTNGTFLADEAHRLKQAGLDRLNISIDTLKENKFTEITRGGQLHEVITGIEKAKRVGLEPVKINIVVIRGTNDDEILDFVKFASEYDVEVRFIEYMPMEEKENWGDAFISMEEVKKICAQLGSLEPTNTSKGNGPAKSYRINDYPKVRLGFISPVSEHFCAACNRIRLTSDGKIKTCLLSNDEIDIRRIIETGNDEKLHDVLRQALFAKPSGHRICTKEIPAGKKCQRYRSKRGMSQIGG